MASKNDGQTVKINCQGARSVPLLDLQDFQGELKSLSEQNYRRLKKQIVDEGFTAAIHVWDNGGKLFIIDGHQRVKCLKRMLNEGWIVPSLPIVPVTAPSYQAAKRILLAHASQFGTVEAKGLHDFMIDADIATLELDESFCLPEINVTSFKKEFFGPADTAPDATPGSKTTVRSFNITYSITFNTLEEQTEWFEFLTWLKRKYPTAATIGERLNAHCRDCRSKDPK